MNYEDLRKPVRSAVADYFAACHAPRWDAPFIPGETPVPVSGKVYDGEDMATVMEAVLDFWLTTGRFAHAFEKSFSEFLGVRHALLCNSGSSANLLALACLTSPKLKDRRLQLGDEVITLASGFPTTVNPIIQHQMIPVFVDVTIPTYNVDVSQLEEALSQKTRAVFLPHTLGNPFDIDAVTAAGADPPSGSGEDRYAAPVWREPHPPAGLPGGAAPQDRRPEELRFRHESGLLDRGVSGADIGYAELYYEHIRRVDKKMPKKLIRRFYREGEFDREKNDE